MDGVAEGLEKTPPHGLWCRPVHTSIAWIRIKAHVTACGKTSSFALTLHRFCCIATGSRWRRQQWVQYRPSTAFSRGSAALITGQSPIRTGLTKVGLPGAELGLGHSIPA